VTSPPPVQSPPARSTPAFWIHAQFTLIGITTVLLGPLLPTLAVHWGMRDLQSGYFFAAQYVGSTLGSLISTQALPRWGFTRVCTAAMLILCVGLEIFVLGSWQLGLAGVFCCGLGMALAIAASNLGVAQSNPGRAAAALSLLNFAWGIGAVACPFLIAAGLRYLPLTQLVPALGVLPLLFALRFATLDSSREARVPASPWNRSAFVLITTLAFLYVGTENAVGGWIASYARNVALLSAGAAAMAPSAFWGALLLGRGLAPGVLRSHSERSIYRLGVMTAVIGTTLVLTTHVVPLLLTGAAIVGLGLAALFPITVAVLSRDLGENSQRLGGFFFAIGNMGGATIPFLVGAVSTKTQSLRAGMALTLLSMALMLVISATFSRRLAFSAEDPG
jgi:FHS family glucose/mannose:H+ symporter-like MFS transporter